MRKYTTHLTLFGQLELPILDSCKVDNDVSLFCVVHILNFALYVNVKIWYVESFFGKNVENWYVCKLTQGTGIVGSVLL